MKMRRMMVGVLMCVALQAWSVVPAGAQGRRALPPETVEGGISPGELQNLFDAYVLMQAQATLQLSDAQYPQFLARLKALQAVRRRTQAERARIIQQLRRLVQSDTDAAARDQMVEQIKALKDADARAVADVAAAAANLDEVLDPLQQAKLRIFEEQMERRKLELLMRARQAARGARNGR